MTKLQNPLDNLEQPETLIKQAKPRENPWHRVQFGWREKKFFRLCALGVFLKALDQEGGENAVHCF